MFAPILVGPMPGHGTLHPDGEHATVQGAAAANTTVVITNRSSVPIAEIAARAKTALWYQAYVERDLDRVRRQLDEAVKAGCRVICLTVTPPDGQSTQAPSVSRSTWRGIEQLRQGITVPVVLKGVMTRDDAQRAVERNIQGLVVSNGGVLDARPAPIEVLPSIVEAVGARVPVLADGSFRRGTDVIKALAFGAKAVLLGRPVMWGLAAYGAEGVQLVLKMLQTELARTMVNVGMPTIASIDRSLVKIHSRATS
jgi:isopentenyl diphosphate isomerase/L-lactate dehydrogenase-like FMN-dependent dehydrogenase